MQGLTALIHQLVSFRAEVLQVATCVYSFLLKLVQAAASVSRDTHAAAMLICMMEKTTVEWCF